MPTSPKPDTLTAIASLSQASNLPPKKPPETDETNPAPWQSPNLNNDEFPLTTTR